MGHYPLILEVDQRSQGPASEAQPAADEIAGDDADQYRSSHSPGQGDLVEFDPGFFDQEIEHVESEQQGQEPEPVLAVGIGDVEVGGPVFLGQPAGVEEDHFIEWDQGDDCQDPGKQQAFGFAADKLQPRFIFQGRQNQVARDEENCRHHKGIEHDADDP